MASFFAAALPTGFAEAADHDVFREAFENKGAMTEWMKRIPVALIEKDDAALYGLAALPTRPRP